MIRCPPHTLLALIFAHSMACQTEPASTPETETSTSQTSGPTTSSQTSTTPSTTEESTHPYIGFVGEEVYEEATNMERGQPMDCRFVWQTTGTAVSPHTCEECEFVFDVEQVFDDWAESFANAISCEYTTGEAMDGRLDTTIRYALQLNYYDLGAVLMVGEEGGYYAWGYASFDVGVLSYSRVLLQDHPYNGYYYTQQRYGSATVD